MTRIAFLSDVHGNLEALECVRADIAALAVERTVCLGDVASYNADQHACMELIVDDGMEWIAGNHDLIACGLLSPVGCGASARHAALKARRELLPRWRRHIHGLPLLLRDEKFLAFHASPRRVDQYVRYEPDAYDLMQLMRAESLPSVAFFGHTHRACVWASRGHGAEEHYTDSIELESDGVYLVNVGSVGEPRDGGLEATYVMFDSRSRRVAFRRVRYDYRAARRKSEAGGWRRTGSDPITTLYDRARRRLGRVRRRLIPLPVDDSSLEAIRRRQVHAARGSTWRSAHEAVR